MGSSLEISVFVAGGHGHAQSFISRAAGCKCGLIPAVWDLAAILFRLPPPALFSASSEPEG